MSITGLGNSYRDQAKMGLRDVAAMEAKREAANEQLKASEKQQKTSTTMTMGGVGLAAGLSGAAGLSNLGWAAGPVGAAAGLAVGWLFSELF